MQQCTTFKNHFFKNTCNLRHSTKDRLVLVSAPYATYESFSSCAEIYYLEFHQEHVYMYKWIFFKYNCKKSSKIIFENHLTYCHCLFLFNPLWNSEQRNKIRINHIKVVSFYIYMYIVHICVNCSIYACKMYKTLYIHSTNIHFIVCVGFPSGFTQLKPFAYKVSN